MHFTDPWATRTSLPNVYHPHDVQHRHFPGYFDALAHRFREATFAGGCHQASIVAVASEWIKSDIMRQYGVPEAKMRVINLPPPELPIVPASTIDQVRRRYAVPEAFIFYAAQTHPHKGHSELIRALALLRDTRGLRIPLVAAGHRTGHFYEIEQVIRRTRTGAQIKFLGSVSPVELASLYSLCRAVVIPSQFEAASFPLFEAFAARKPAACAAVTSLPAQAAGAALLFDPFNVGEMAAAIQRVWQDEVTRSALILRGSDRISGMSWKGTALQFRALYRQLAGSRVTKEDEAVLTSVPRY